MFKVNNKDTNGVVLVSLLLMLTYFTSCSSVSIVNFEHWISGWDINKYGTMFLQCQPKVSYICLSWYNPLLNQLSDALLLVHVAFEWKILMIWKFTRQFYIENGLKCINEFQGF